MFGTTQLLLLRRIETKNKLRKLLPKTELKFNNDKKEIIPRSITGKPLSPSSQTSST